mgnify:CR=1 FL=1
MTIIKKNVKKTFNSNRAIEVIDKKGFRLGLGDFKSRAVA